MMQVKHFRIQKISQPTDEFEPGISSTGGQCTSLCYRAPFFRWKDDLIKGTGYIL